MSKKSSLRVSFLDGVFATIMVAVTSNYVTPFALLIGATGLYIGLLTSIPQLASSIVQLWSAEISRKFSSRLRFIYLTVFYQAFTFFLIPPILLLPQKYQVLSYVILISVMSLIGAVSAPSWWSLMSDTVDKDKYGEYFAWRGKMLGFVNLAGTVLAGFFLFVVHNKFAGFVILFLVSGICRAISGTYVAKMDDIPARETKEKDFSYWQFIRRFKESNFVKFVLFIAVLNFVVFIASPFFAVYMLQDLKLSYFTYTVIISSGMIANLMGLPFWGRLADKYGNAKVLRLSVILIPVFPILFTLVRDPVYLTIVNFLGNYAFAGFGLAAFNYIFDAASEQVRTKCVAYFNFTNGICIFLGASLGGYLVTCLPALGFSSNLVTLLGLSGLLRAVVILLMINSFREVRKVPEITDESMLYMFLGISSETSMGEGPFKKK